MVSLNFFFVNSYKKKT